MSPSFRTGGDINCPGIAHGFFGREGGVSKGLYASLNCGPGSDDDRDSVMENRARVARSLHLEPENLITLYQHHSSDAIEVTSPWTPDHAPKADAMVCSTPGIALGILTADCAPVLFADPKAKVIGAAHAGWKGALGGVLEAVIDLMESKGAGRSNIRAVIGPTISQSNYEVGPEFHERFLTAAPDHVRFFKSSTKADHFMFDLPGFVRQRLKTANIGCVQDVSLCTYDDASNLFSYRRATHLGENGYGRNISVIALEG